GHLDLFVTNGDVSPQNNFLYQNTGIYHVNHWLGIKLVGTRSNRSAIGATVWVGSNVNGVWRWQTRSVLGQTGYNAQMPGELHFGLGEAGRVDSLVIHWPSGIIQPVAPVPADQVLVIEEDSTITGVPSPGASPPTGFWLGQNYPNPFNPGTIVEFGLTEPKWVILKIYDLLGREVKTLVNGRLAPGRYTLHWDGRDDAGNPVGSGIYLYRLNAGGQVQSRKMVRLR
ncbi:MAG: T9SS C-terminal target domain-containing protein, partial [Calditrichaeota bacterium]